MSTSVSRKASVVNFTPAFPVHTVVPPFKPVTAGEWRTEAAKARELGSESLDPLLQAALPGKQVRSTVATPVAATPPSRYLPSNNRRASAMLDLGAIGSELRAREAEAGPSVEGALAVWPLYIINAYITSVRRHL